MKNSAMAPLATVIDRIGRPDFYPSMFQYLRHCVEFDNIIAIVYIGNNVPVVENSEVYGPDVFRYVSEQYLSGAYLLDPIYQLHLGRGTEGLYRLLDVAPDQFRSSRYFKWYYDRIGISDEISVFLPVEDRVTITISMGKDGSTGLSFSHKSEERLRDHQPVIMSLLRANWSAQETPLAKNPKVASVTDHLRTEMARQKGVVLSQRQAEVALLILRGHSTPSIAEQLQISPQTVKVFRKQLYSRCAISSQAELFALMMPMLGVAEHHQQISQVGPVGSR